MDDLYSASGPDEGMEVEEPDWILHNRQWYEDHPEVSWMKFSPATLQGWVCTGDPTPPEDLSDGPLNIDVLFASRPSRTFISAISPDAPDLEQMGVGQLFNDEACSTPTTATSKVEESRRKYWTKEEETALATFLEHYCQKVPKGAWAHISKSLRRSQTSVCAKAAQLRKFGLNRQSRVSDPDPKRPRLEDMVKLALERLPGQEGTKDEIVTTIELMFASQLQDSQSKAGGVRWKNSVKQVISTVCQRMPGVYRLNPNVSVPPREKCNTMQDYIIWALGKGPATMQDLKLRIKDNFEKWLNDSVNPDSALCIWEKTLLKKLKHSPFVDHSHSATRYKVRR